MDPTVTRNADGTATINWPDPKPVSVLISSDLLEQMVAMHNRYVLAFGEDTWPERV